MEKNKHTFSEAEIELLKEGLKRSYKERFEMDAWRWPQLQKLKVFKFLFYILIN
jgi:hypothetical protein